MADAGFFKGTSTDQDRRFSDKEMKLLKSMKFPPEFDKKVDMRKVNLHVLRPWIAKKVVELLGLEDEVVVEYAMGLLEDKSNPTPDPKKMQINLTGFLTNKTAEFMTSLWNLLIEAQSSTAGVPKSFLDEKKEEMRRAAEKDSRAIDERDRRARLDDVRERERSERNGGRGWGRGRGGRGRGGFDDERSGRGRDNGWGGRGGGRQRPPRSRSRTPPLRRRSPSPRDRSRSRTPTFDAPRSIHSGSRRGSRSPHVALSKRGDGDSRSPPPPRRRSRSRSISSPPPRRRRQRSPSYDSPRRRRSPPRRRRSPPPRRGAAGRRISYSRSPPRRRRRQSPPPRSRSRSFSRSPPVRGKRGGGYGSSRSKSRSRSRTPPPRRRSFSRSPARKDGKRVDRSRNRSAGSNAKRMRSSSLESDRDGRMDVDRSNSSVPRAELKIKGQAEAEKRRKDDGNSPVEERIALERRENELKEKALRNKVVRSRKENAGDR